MIVADKVYCLPTRWSEEENNLISGYTPTHIIHNIKYHVAVENSGTR